MVSVGPRDVRRMVLYLENDAHDLSDLYGDLNVGKVVSLFDVCSRRVVSHNRIHSLMNEERMLFFDSCLTNESITVLPAEDGFGIPLDIAYNCFGGNCLETTIFHDCVVFVLKSVGKDIHEDVRLDCYLRVAEGALSEDVTKEVIFYGFHAKKGWSFAQKCPLCYVTCVREENGKIIVSEGSIVSEECPAWFTDDVSIFDSLRVIPSDGVQYTATDELSLLTDPECGAGYIGEMNTQSALFKPCMLICGDVQSLKSHNVQE